MTCLHPLTGQELPLIEVEMGPSFGTGLHTVTPAHSINDLKLSYKYNLSRQGILDPRTG
jgi:valyl-tRNA synthetase